MKNILVIETSPRGKESVSRKLTKAILEKLKQKDPGCEVKLHDLSTHPTPHLEESHLAAFYAPPEKHTAENKEAVSHSNKSIAEVMAADTIVIGVPMYNFSIPSTLKAWIDHLVRAGITFRYTATGPEGLIKGKKVYLAIATGGIYSEGAMKPFDFTEPYLRAVLGFLGMTDVTAFRVEGVAVPGVQDTALEKGVASIRL
jgi:FMN-dependent NADH-azoreductase